MRGRNTIESITARPAPTSIALEREDGQDGWLSIYDHLSREWAFAVTLVTIKWNGVSCQLASHPLGAPAY